ncbi:MAG: two-component regulator propeller domain-containing protein, partial [Bacteroidota bacterium]
MLVFCWNFASAQRHPLEESWRWVRFAESSGLPSNRVYDVIDAPDGTPWAWTEGGISWYDGYRWNSVPHSDRFKDVSGRKFGGFLNGRVFWLCDRGIFTADQTGVTRLPIDDVTDATLLQGDTLLLLWKGKYHYWTVGKSQTLAESRSHDSGLRIMGGTHGRYWYSLGWNELWRRERTRSCLLIRADRCLLGTSDFCGMSDGSGLVLVGYPHKMRGVWEWNESSTAARRTLRTISQPWKSALAKTGDAIVLYEEHTYQMRRQRRWTGVRPLPRTIPAVTTLRYRANGDLWAATENGLFLCKLASSIAQPFSWPEPDSRNRTNDLLRDRRGGLWIATSGGVVRVPREGKPRTWTKLCGIRFSVVTGVIEDKDGEIWVCSGADFPGAFHWNGKQWDHHPIRDGGMDVNIHRMYSDLQGRLWFAGLSHIGRSRYNSNPGVFVLESGRIRRWARSDGLPHKRVYSILQTPDSAIWFGTWNGIGRWKNGRWSYYAQHKNEGARYVVSMEQGSDGKLYFGMGHSWEKGLGVIEKDGKIRYYSTAHGLPNDYIQELRRDPDGNLWATTRNGLACLHEGKLAVFNENIGLQSMSLWPLRIYGDTLYVGTTANGYAIVDLSKLRRPMPRIIIKQPSVDKQRAVISWDVNTHWGSVSPEDVLTRFRVDGGGWSAWTRKHSTVLERMSNGDHVIQVQAKGQYGQYDNAGVASGFSVPLPPLLRWYVLGPMLLLSVALFVVILIFIRRRRAYFRELRRSE